MGVQSRHRPLLASRLADTMRGFLAFFVGCAIVAALTLIHPDNARWVALALLAVLFVASAIPRRVQPTAEEVGQPVRGTGSSNS